MSSHSKKRKLGDVAATKYYAVRAGFKPGVYLSWAECQQQTTGFRGAQFKSFLIEQEAEDFVAGRVTPSTSSKGDKFYGVAVGRNPGVYEEWADAQEQLRGVKGPKYKKFPTRAEAEAFVRSGGRSSTPPKVVAGEPAAKKVRTSTGSNESTESAESMESTAYTAKRKTTCVYTDGSARGNGRQGAYAGVGVFFGDNDERNVSEPLRGEVQTNQRAELTAIQRALEIAPKDHHVRIITDSNYSINCCDLWYKKWCKNGWKTSLGEPVINKDLIVLVRNLIDERDAMGSATIFEWIKGHSHDAGNTAADHLAVAGAFAGRS